MNKPLTSIKVVISTSDGHSVKATGKCNPEHVEGAIAQLAREAGEDLCKAYSMNMILFGEIRHDHEVIKGDSPKA